VISEKENMVIFLYLYSMFINLSLFLFTKCSSGYEKTDIDSYQIVERNKEWVIVFDRGINESVLNSNNIYVLDDRNNRIPVKIQREDNVTIKILPPKEGYKTGSNYYLFINKDLDLEHSGKDTQQKEYKIAFKVDKNV
jgi:hypothetical protein